MDPLENIMGMLRRQGAIDPNEHQARMASLQAERGQLGAGPPATHPRQKPPERQQPTPSPRQQPGAREEGREGDVQVAPGDMTPVLVDQLNEAIISLKVQIHREADQERRRQLEKQAEQLRGQIQQLGGEPIWADESVEEGLQKLRGMGYIGAPQMDMWQRLPGYSPGYGYDPHQPRTRAIPQYDAMRQRATAAPTTQTAPATAYQYGRAVPTREETPPTDFWERATYPGQVATPTAEPVAPPTEQVPGEVTDVLQRLGVSPPTVRELPTAEPGLYTDAIPEAPPRDELSDILRRIGEERAAAEGVEGPPEPMVSAEYFNEVIQQMGLSPRSPAEIQQHARAIVDRQRFPQEQQIQRELERFERDFPNEFQQAQEQIRQFADEISAERQEEFASRGMYYSSVMARGLTEIDEAAVAEISDIAREAASHVAELRADLRDIAQWAVLEEEVVRRELEAETREQQERLMQMHMQVAMWADQMALDSWYQQSQIALQDRQVQLQELQLMIDEAERQGQHLAMAFMGDHPIVQDSLRRMGISPEMFSQMSLEQRSHLVSSIAGFAEMEMGMRMQETQIAAILADMEISRAQLQLDARRLDLTEQQMMAEMSEAEQLLADPNLVNQIYEFLNAGEYDRARAWTNDYLPPGAIRTDILSSIDQMQQQDEAGKEADKSSTLFSITGFLNRLTGYASPGILGEGLSARIQGLSPGGTAWPLGETRGTTVSGGEYGASRDGGARRHAGLDLAAPTGTPIFSVAPGTVTRSGSAGGYGNMVEIDHGDGYVTRYAHNSRNLVSVGDTVSAGQRIALVGSTGQSTGPHLHFEVRKDGSPVNPNRYVNFG